MKRTSDVQLKFTTSEMIEKIHRIVMKDHRIKMRDITEIVGISVDRMHNILHKELEMKKCMSATIADKNTQWQNCMN